MPERFLGRQLGRFRIDSIIGSGGFAWVYKGYDPELDIPIAVKVLKPQYSGDETFETRFRREASTAAKLRHPNIIRILAVGRQDDAVYSVMDYLPTGLDDRLRIMGTLPESLLIRLGMDVSAALAFAHREGVIHRDIKTDNILFDEHGNAIVADFGIARALTGYVEQTGTNMVVGTPQYFSPEQARGQVLDGRADIYSLGVTLFKAATGVLPFQGEDWYDIARQHVEEPPPRPRTFNPALSRGAERVILKCLAKDPAERYPTGDALHTELVQLLGRAALPDGDATVAMATPVMGDAVTPHAHAGQWWRTARWPTLVGVAGALLAVALVGSALHMRGATTPDAVAARPQRGAGAAATSLDSTVRAAPAEGGASSSASPAPGGAGPSSTATAGLVATTPAPPRELRVEAPDDAEVWLDGTRVGHGRWHTAGVSAGEHVVMASIHTVPQCPTATAESTIRVREHGTTAATLAPHPCGFLVIDAFPVGSRWEVTTSDGAKVASGVVPLVHPVVLPVGAYSLRVSASFCADYHSDFSIVSAQSHRERLTLICD